jgi:hypothetical protein
MIRKENPLARQFLLIGCQVSIVIDFAFKGNYYFRYLLKSLYSPVIANLVTD